MLYYARTIVNADYTMFEPTGKGGRFMLWNHWWNLVCQLRPACARTRTFLWMSLCLAGMTVRKDLLGVTSIVRALGLEPACYDRLLDFFHSSALDLDKLTCAWCALISRLDSGILRVNGRPVLVGDGIKVAKAGRKMPGVKKLHQESESNNKAEYIFGHSCQAVAVLTQALSSVFALPLACRIHEGTVFSNRDQRTLLDKMILLIDSLRLKEPFYFVADAYYASGKIVRGLLAHGNHLVTRVKSNSVAFFPATPPPPHRPRRKGRPAKYGKKVKVAALLQDGDRLQEAPSPVYGEKGVTLRFRTADLLWRPVGILVRFVVVLHPLRGTILLMCTDLTLPPLDVIRIYGLRFKIEVSFKQAIHVIGAYAYHFWMAAMTPLRRVSGNQHLHRKSEDYRNAVRRKIAAYHRHIQLGLIAQGLLQILAATQPKLIWRSFGSWIRTVRPGLAPSEQVVAVALRHTFPEFLATAAKTSIFVKFIRDRIDLSRTEGTSLAA
jgi:DDE superfamily endonuclease